MDNPLENLNPLIPALYASGMTAYFIISRKIRLANIGDTILTFVIFGINVFIFLIAWLLPYYLGFFK